MFQKDKRTVYIHYYALLREERGLPNETLTTEAKTVSQLYEQLRVEHKLSMSPEILKVSVNDSFQAWDTPLHDQDAVVFIPPVAGG